mmetsp:Transcript_12385/g.27298  ORF Transcript_12385/g.27298 Transcript_12385/m.27298 type:complete len:231 (-) Transcript_12385:806-1498(-)
MAVVASFLAMRRRCEALANTAIVDICCNTLGNGILAFLMGSVWLATIGKDKYIVKHNISCLIFLSASFVATFLAMEDGGDALLIESRFLSIEGMFIVFLAHSIVAIILFTFCFKWMVLLANSIVAILLGAFSFIIIVFLTHSIIAILCFGTFCFINIALLAYSAIAVMSCAFCFIYIWWTTTLGNKEEHITLFACSIVAVRLLSFPFESIGCACLKVSVPLFSALFASSF